MLSDQQIAILTLILIGVMGLLIYIYTRRTFQTALRANIPDIEIVSLAMEKQKQTTTIEPDRNTANVVKTDGFHVKIKNLHPSISIAETTLSLDVRIAERSGLKKQVWLTWAKTNKGDIPSIAPQQPFERLLRRGVDDSFEDWLAREGQIKRVSPPSGSQPGLYRIDLASDLHLNGLQVRLTIRYRAGTRGGQSREISQSYGLLPECVNSQGVYEGFLIDWSPMIRHVLSHT